MKALFNKGDLNVIRFLIVILSYSILVVSVQAQTISIRADYWYPMNGDPNSDKPGYMIDLAKAIFEPQGIAVDYQLMPWSRAIQETRVGNSDCVVGAYKSDTRDFLFAKAHWGIDQTLFYKLKTDKWVYKGNVAALNTRKVGVISDYSYGSELDEVFNTIKVQRAKGDQAVETNIKKLITGRIDTMIESHYVMDSKLLELALTDKVVSAGDTLQGEPMYLACTPNSARSKKLIEIVNKAIPELKRSGRFKQILQKYNIESW
ncbi:MAG: polar amino acid transport system substrate-binding protein [Oceanicoccus sp.]